jgi:hypothetical protein
MSLHCYAKRALVGVAMQASGLSSSDLANGGAKALHALMNATGLRI